MSKRIRGQTLLKGDATHQQFIAWLRKAVDDPYFQVLRNLWTVKRRLSMEVSKLTWEVVQLREERTRLQSETDQRCDCRCAENNRIDTNTLSP